MRPEEKELVMRRAREGVPWQICRVCKGLRMLVVLGTEDSGARAEWMEEVAVDHMFCSTELGFYFLKWRK